MHELWVWLLLLWPLLLSRRDEARCSIAARRSVLLLLLGLTARYLHWRLSATLNLATTLSSALSWLLLAAETWLLLSALLPLLLSWRRFDDGRAEADAAEARWNASTWRPSVDVLVPTCGEPLPVLERCLVGCSGLSYPHVTVWVLDDSGRESVRALAARHGCRYLSRGDRRGAKAGNLNAGLAASNGQLVAVFDADFVPQRHFLQRTIGLLVEPDVALVQTPQVFFNADPLMRNLAMERWMLPDEDNFYRWIEPVRSGWGAVVCAGTSFVAKRAALEAVGGFNEAALSEDFVTGIALLGSGWRLRYLGEPLSAGLAAETLLDFVRQRQRWAAGTLQSLTLASGPLRQRGLRWSQRLALLEGCVHWLNPLPRLLLLLMPLSYGLLGTAPIVIQDQGLLSAALPLWMALLLSVGWLNRRSRYALLTELPSWVLTVPLASTAINSLLGRFAGFRITPKQQPRSRGGASLLLAGPLLGLLLLSGINLAHLLRNPSATNPAGQALGVVWALLMLIGLLVALRACWDCADSDPQPWIRIPGLQGHLSAGQDSRCRAQLVALSERGADLVVLAAALPLDLAASRTLQLALAGTDQPGPLHVEIEATASLPQQQVRLSVRWGSGQEPELLRLQRWLFCRPGCWQQRPAANEPLALLALFRQLLRAPRRLGPGQRSLVLQAADNGAH